jgi:hypothetical protein
MIIGATSRYNGMIFHVARRHNAILYRTPHILTTPHEKSLRRQKRLFKFLGPRPLKM